MFETGSRRSYSLRSGSKKDSAGIRDKITGSFLAKPNDEPKAVLTNRSSATETHHQDMKSGNSIQCNRTLDSYRDDTRNRSGSLMSYGSACRSANESGNDFERSWPKSNFNSFKTNSDKTFHKTEIETFPSTNNTFSSTLNNNISTTDNKFLSNTYYNELTHSNCTDVEPSEPLHLIEYSDNSTKSSNHDEHLVLDEDSCVSENELLKKNPEDEKDIDTYAAAPAAAAIDDDVQSNGMCSHNVILLNSPMTARVYCSNDHTKQHDDHTKQHDDHTKQHDDHIKQHDDHMRQNGDYISHVQVGQSSEDRSALVNDHSLDDHLIVYTREQHTDPSSSVIEETGSSLTHLHIINGNSSKEITEKAEEPMTPPSGYLHLGLFDANVAEPEHPYFVRLAAESAEPTPILSKRGTVRGVKNQVRAGIASLLDKHTGKKVVNYPLLEKGKVVFYTTSVSVVRDTFERCLKVKRILQTQMVEFVERDIFMSKATHQEFLDRIQGDAEVPQVFVDGYLLGGTDEIERLNENGVLRKIFSNFKKVQHPKCCTSCGGYRYVPCTSCHGSKKSRRNFFPNEFCTLRCTTCDDNGLVKCNMCNVVDDGPVMASTYC